MPGPDPWGQVWEPQCRRPRETAETQQFSLNLMQFLWIERPFLKNMSPSQVWPVSTAHGGCGSNGVWVLNLDLILTDAHLTHEVLIWFRWSSMLHSLVSGMRSPSRTLMFPGSMLRSRIWALTILTCANFKAWLFRWARTSNVKLWLLFCLVIACRRSKACTSCTNATC